MSIAIILYVCYAILQSIFFSKYATKPTERDNYNVMVFVYVALAPFLTLGFLLYILFMLLKWMRGVIK